MTGFMVEVESEDLRALLMAAREAAITIPAFARLADVMVAATISNGLGGSCEAALTEHEPDAIDHMHLCDKPAGHPGQHHDRSSDVRWRNTGARA